MDIFCYNFLSFKGATPRKKPPRTPGGSAAKSASKTGTAGRATASGRKSSALSSMATESSFEAESGDLMNMQEPNGLSSVGKSLADTFDAVISPTRVRSARKPAAPSTSRNLFLEAEAEPVGGTGLSQRRGRKRKSPTLSSLALGLLDSAALYSRTEGDAPLSPSPAMLLSAANQIQQQQSMETAVAPVSNENEVSSVTPISAPSSRRKRKLQVEEELNGNGNASRSHTSTRKKKGVTEERSLVVEPAPQESSAEALELHEQTHHILMNMKSSLERDLD